MESVKSTPKTNDISLVAIIENVKKYRNYLFSKWLVILIFGLSGAIIGLVASFIVKPTYTAHLSFSLVEKSSGGGLADLASSFGFSGLASGSSNGAFSGDNLLEIIKSRYAIEKTLLTPVVYNGKTQNLVEVFIEFNKIRKVWHKEKKNKELRTLSYPVGQKRETFSRTQDSVLNCFYEGLSNIKTITIARKDKKTSIVNVDFKSNDELFSKLFVETLMSQTYLFYKKSKTALSRANVNMMQHTADSIKGLYEAALYKGAGISQVNINQAIQYAAVPRIKQERDVQIYGVVYTEVLKNLETLKLDMARETPIVQLIDEPRLPLKKEKIGKAKGIIFGGLLGGFLIVGYLLGLMFVKDKLKELK